MDASHALERVEVIRGRHGQDVDFGPLPGVRLGNVVAYEFELPERFEPRPGLTRLQRVFVLLDLGVSFSDPCWARRRDDDGTVFENDPNSLVAWYVDLVKVEVTGNQYAFRDLYIDVMVPMDGRHYRVLDLDEYADAMAAGMVSLEDAIDGLRRWQWFLDLHLHTGLWPSAQWSDFPPECIRELAELPAPLGEPISYVG